MDLARLLFGAGFQIFIVTSQMFRFSRELHELMIIVDYFIILWPIYLYVVIIQYIVYKRTLLRRLKSTLRQLFKLSYKAGKDTIISLTIVF